MLKHYLHVSSRKIAIGLCSQMLLVAQIAPKICSGQFFNIMSPSLQSDLLSDNSSQTSFNSSSVSQYLRGLPKSFIQLSSPQFAGPTRLCLMILLLYGQPTFTLCVCKFHSLAKNMKWKRAPLLAYGIDIECRLLWGMKCSATLSDFKPPWQIQTYMCINCCLTNLESSWILNQQLHVLLYAK